MTDRVAALVGRYASAFDTLDPDRIMAFYDVPATIVDSESTVVFASRDDIRANMQRLVDSYRSLGFRAAEPSDIRVDHVGDDLYQADVEWALHTDSSRVVFSTRYWIVDRPHGLRIAAVLAFSERERTSYPAVGA